MAIPRVLARMKARALRAMNQSCYVLSESGAALNSAGGRSAAKTTWNPVLSQAWSSTTTYAFNAPANGVDGKLYHSLIANNLDREPSASPTYWALGFPCLVWLVKSLARINEEGGSMQTVERYACALPLGTPVTTKNRIAVIGGSTYEVVGVNLDNANAVQIVLDLKLVS